MANDKDKLFEKIYFLWKAEGEKRNLSIDWYCERYHADVEEFRKWYQGINHSVKEVQVVGRPVQPEAPKQETEAAEAADAAMRRLRGQQESEARIVVTTSDACKKPKPAIASLTINLGNGLHKICKGMSFDEFLTKTELIVQRIRMKLLELKIQLHQAPETISALLKDAITYLDNAWKEVFAYRQNGDFTIDNMAAERAIKPLANQ